MEIVENCAVRLHVPTDYVPAIVRNIEKVEVLKQDELVSEIVVYWGIEEMQFLTRLLGSDKIPSSINRDYKWPGLYNPFKHQITTASFLTLHRKAFCFNEAGTGKTSSVIWASDYLMNEGAIKRVLVICPLSIMYSAWQADIFKTAMHRTAGVAHGPADKRKKIIRGAYDFVIINYDGVHIVQKEIEEAAFDLIVVDEANAYKTATTKRWKTLSKILKPTTRLWMLTGTPASQSPTDAFGLAKLVCPENVPKFFTGWRDKVMRQLTRFKYVPKPTAKRDVYEALQPAIRFSKAECLDLPPVVYQTREVPLSPQVVRYYKNLKDQMLIEAAGEKISAVHAAARLNKLLQLSGGAVYTDNGEVVEFDVSPRLNALLEVIEETEHKVLVFVPYRHTIELVANFLASHGVTTRTINGDVSAKDRAQIINEFQTTDEPRLLIIQPQSASHGVTLTAADTIVFWSPVMSVETYLQCVARIDRVGQVNSMTVVHIQGSEVERKMYEMLRGKVSNHEKLVDLYKQELGIE
ncbi:MAG: DEAD/DEAH box helicase [Caulobacteraceae bacterium]|nr:DEAD/DEAH box helicase [Caulobacteraceae bacterium]